MSQTIYFRHEFRFDKNQWDDDLRGVTLTLGSKLPGLKAWLNGNKVSVPPPDNRGRHECKLAIGDVQRGRNQLLVAVSPSGPANQEKESAESPKKPGAAPQRKRPRPVRPEADLEPDEDDEVLEPDKYLHFQLFKELKRQPNLAEYPQAIILRRYNQGDLICVQGEAGNSAFYILTSEDLFELRKSQFPSQRWDIEKEQFQDYSPQQVLALLNDNVPQDADQDQIHELRQLAERLLELEGGPEQDDRRLGATAHIIPGAKRVFRGGGLWNRMKGLFSSRTAPVRDLPAYIRNDGPTDIDPETLQAPMYEGELFGEMSCMTFSPRSATVIANRDLFLVEFLRNVFADIQKDESYRERMLKKYQERVLSTHLGRLEFFRNLTEEQIEWLQDRMELKIVDAGTVICHEGDSPDYVYIIRTGLVQIVAGLKGLDVTLTPQTVKDWDTLCQAMAEGDPAVPNACPNCEAILVAPSRDYLGRKASCYQCKHKFILTDPDEREVELAKPAAKKRGTKKTPIQSMWESLPRKVQAIVRRAVYHADHVPGDADKDVLLDALNNAARSIEFVSNRAFRSLLKRDERIQEILQRVNKWTGLETSVRGRLLLQKLLPESLAEPQISEKSLRILNYRGRGDIFGEMAVIDKKPRNATCIAYGHPVDDTNRKPGQVELIAIPVDAFDDLLRRSPDLARDVQRLADQKHQELKAVESEPVWDHSNLMFSYEEFRDRGFIQGQKLMLIDLDSCTRCGDCVCACVNTHDDGYSRLFLDGPTFDKYLVPSACRNCIDPSCLIGCPVDAIHKGDNGQIVIEDWCVGCETCYRQCPYDSIQMHDTGLIPDESPGWSFCVAADTAIDAAGPSPSGSAWRIARSPFQWDLDFRQALVGALPAETPCPIPSDWKFGDTILSARLDVDRKPPLQPGMTDEDMDQLRIQALPATAVVCDQCSTLPNQQPACVDQCPHEAALRIDARTHFPVGRR